VPVAAAEEPVAVPVKDKAFAPDDAEKAASSAGRAGSALIELSR
jgi:hypothetical protein